MSPPYHSTGPVGFEPRAFGVVSTPNAYDYPTHPVESLPAALPLRKGADPIDYVECILDVHECLTEQRAREMSAAWNGVDNSVRVIREDRTGEGWAVLAYWTLDSGRYGRRTFEHVSTFEGAQVLIPE